MNKILKCLTLFFLWVSTPAFSQCAEQSNSFPDNAVFAARKAYADFSAQQLPFINGVQYYEILRDPSVDRGHPYFLSESMEKGILQYDQIRYFDISLQYDIVNDQIITVLPGTNFKISLIKDKIQSFSILGHCFVTMGDKRTAPGFYELLLDGRAKVIAKRTKKIQESNYNYNIDHRKRFMSRNEWYVVVNDRFYLIGKKKSLMLAMQDRSQEVNSFLRQMKTSFRKDKERFIVELTKYYNNLN